MPGYYGAGPMHAGACGFRGRNENSLSVLYAPERQVDTRLSHVRFLWNLML